MPLLQEDPPRVGRYRLLARLGAGGMGVVYLGEADDGQQAAVKVLRPEYADDAESRARFRREAAVLALVRSRYTVRVLDADPDSDTPFLATEFADGPSLSEYVSSHGPLEPATLEGLAYALAEALAAIHAAGVTHRDLKPSNVLLTSTGPKVIDFGIAQIADASSVTRTGVTIGSPGYMAPEQVTGHGGRRGDIFAWALVVAFAASGLPPFGSGPALAILHRIRDENPDISAVPSRLLPVVTSALAKDPALRPTALELLRELPADSAEGLASRMAVPEMAGAVPAAGFPAPDSAFASLTSSSSSADVGPRRRWRAAAVAAPVVALAVTGGVLMAGTGVRPGNLPSAGPSPRPTVTHSASPHAGSGSGSGTGSGAMTGGGAPQGQMAGSHAPSGQVVRHKRATDAAASDSATPSASSSTASPSATSPSVTSSGTGSGSPSPSPGGSSAPPSPSPSTSSDPGGSGSADPTGSG